MKCRRRLPRGQVKNFAISLLLLSLSLNPNLLHTVYAEDVNISTYYPSPYGAYKKLQIEDAGGPIGTFTGGVTQAGLQIISTYIPGNYTPGVFWTTSDDNPTRPKAGIWMLQEDDALTGSKLFFGTSNTYNAGITNTGMVLDHEGNLGIGTTTPSQRLHVTAEDAATTTVTDVLKINHSSSDVPANNFGTGLLFSGSSATVNNRNMARIQSTWTNATDAARTSSLQFQTEDNAAANLTTHMTLSSSGLDVSADGGSILVPRKTTSGDPTGTNGMIYYNSTTNRFRIYQNGAWTNMGGGSTIQLAQGYRHDDSSPATTPPRPIIVISAPAGSTPFVALNNVAPPAPSAYVAGTTWDGIKCNEAEGWVITGAWLVEGGGDNDLASVPNGVVSNDMDGASGCEISISCMRVI